LLEAGQGAEELEGRGGDGGASLGEVEERQVREGAGKEGEQACVEKVGRGAVGEAELWKLGVWLEEGERVGVGDLDCVPDEGFEGRDRSSPFKERGVCFVCLCVDGQRTEMAVCARCAYECVEHGGIYRGEVSGSRMCRTGKARGSSPKECVSLRSPRNEIQTNDFRVEAQSLRILAHRRDVLPLAGARKFQRSSRRSVRSGHLGVAIECGKLTANPSSALTRYSFTCWTGGQARAVYVEGGMEIPSS
jgi:hypothetical protein